MYRTLRPLTSKTVLLDCQPCCWLQLSDQSHFQILRGPEGGMVEFLLPFCIYMTIRSATSGALQALKAPTLLIK